LVSKESGAILEMHVWLSRPWSSFELLRIIPRRLRDTATASSFGIGTSGYAELTLMSVAVSGREVEIHRMIEAGSG
jgi:hypothetical protein